MRVSITIPTHNEEAVIKENLEFLSREIPKLLPENNWEILVVENGSSDSTLELVQTVNKENPNIKILSSYPAGKGRAIKTGWDSNDADILFFMDADLATDVSVFPKFIEKHLTGSDLVIGNRWDNNSVVDRSLARSLYSKIYNLLAGAILNDHTPDHQCGFKSITKTAWQKISPQMESNSWFFDSELLGIAKHFGFSVAELPVSWSEKRTGKDKSKVKIFKTAKNLLINLFKLRKRLARLPKE